MPGPRPELLFVSGPQKGQRAVLMRDFMLGGRSDLADVTFTEEFISREQLQFQRIAEGWIVTRLAQSNPMSINQKRYKPDKQILLASGDVIAIGSKTEILFVDPMDDPNQVLANYRRDHPEEQPVPVEPESPVAEMQEQSSALQPVSPTPGKPAVTKKRKKSGQTSSKARKYLLAFVAYLAVLGVVVIFLFQLKKDNNRTEETAPERLKANQISDALRSDLEKSPNEVSAQRSLKEARTHFRLRTSERRNRYRCLTAYRLYRAYRRPEQRTFLPEDERRYNQVVEELTSEVQEIYDRAWMAERNAQWSKAKEQYELLMEYIPLSLADDDPEVRKVLEKVMDHMRYVSKHRGKK